MKPEQPEPGGQNPEKYKNTSPSKNESKFMSGLKKVGFNVWLAVMIIGGALAFITALFLI
ncbi:hypothetical protein [Salinimicrobium sp. TH3]|uniref:hypothetical protein n=1 Tax=Salinimicrobium sp. TH3 TaxID=2997342 RepID=UPI0022755167|nr:hypothetical protein [Salinimicrobium sp. TH3]MCY2687494.1 hypothetical protein [Salinimicrobium sp. TH3]